jgi:creatinine amidohydrolase
MILYNLTWEEVSRLDRQMLVLAPFGAVEQHSLHLPLGTDSIICTAIAGRLEAKLPDQVLVLPSVWLGCSRHHMDFSGSLTAEIDTFIETGEQIVDSMAKHGFRNFILLNSHGGNVTKVSIMAEKLRYRPGPLIKVVGVTYWNLISEEIAGIRESALGGMGHACELETSLMLATQPELVRQERMEADGPAKLSPFEDCDMFAPGSVSVTRAFKDLSRHGGLGDPTTASREKGERIFAAIIEKLAQVVQEIRSGGI